MYDSHLTTIDIVNAVIGVSGVILAIFSFIYTRMLNSTRLRVKYILEKSFLPEGNAVRVTVINKSGHTVKLSDYYLYATPKKMIRFKPSTMLGADPKEIDPRAAVDIYFYQKDIQSQLKELNLSVPILLTPIVVDGIGKIFKGSTFAYDDKKQGLEVLKLQ